MSRPGGEGLRHRGKSGTWKQSGDDALSAPQAQTKTALSAPLLSADGDEDDSAASGRTPLLAGSSNERVFRSNAADRKSYMGSKWRGDSELNVAGSAEEIRSNGHSAGAGGHKEAEPTAGTKIKKGAFSACCAVLDVFPSGFSVKLFAPELNNKEKKRLQEYENKRLVSFDRAKEPHREALTMLWYNCHNAKPIHAMALGHQPDKMPRESVGKEGEEGAVVVAEGKEFVSEEWKEFGFQGVDPATDFRGGGVFSLYNLVAFSNSYPYTFSKILQEADYPAAVAGINISMMVLHILGLTKGKVTCLATTQLKHNYTSACARTKLGRIVLRNAEASMSPDLDIEIERVLHEVYVVAFGVMHQIWTSKPKPRNIMEFNSVFPKVRERMDIVLRSADTLDKILDQSPYPLE